MENFQRVALIVHGNSDLKLKDLGWGAGAGASCEYLIASEPELMDDYLIAPELEPELVLFYGGSPALF